MEGNALFFMRWARGLSTKVRIMDEFVIGEKGVGIF
jgi:hypothetical protein